jgi:glutamate synthase domain-containing protein 2/rubredoxin
MIYRCKMCGELYDEAAGVKFAELPETWVCPVCGAPKSLFEPVEEEVAAGSGSFAVPVESDMAYIQHIAATGEMLVEPSGTQKAVADWDEVLLLAAQLSSKPLADDINVVTKTVIGKNAKHPLTLDAPILVAHMSYGALSGDNKTAIARGAASVGVATSSGEGGIYEPEFAAAGKYIFEYVPHKYSVTDDNLQKVDAIEIKIGQSAKPGLGGHLPGSKVTAEIAAMRGVAEGKDVVSPPAFEELNYPEDLKNLVEELRQRSNGRPIGVKLAANSLEADLEWIKFAKPDFLTIDGRGGGTGAAPKILKDAAGVPTLYAISRTRKFLDENKLDIDLIATGGLRTSADFAKCLALGADAVAVATAVLTALAAAGDLSADKKVENYLKVSIAELKMFTRATGHTNVHELDLANLATVSHEIATYTDIKHV